MAALQHGQDREGSEQRQDPSGGKAAGANGNADGRGAKPVAQAENQIDAADQGQRWDDAGGEHVDSKPSPDTQRADKQHANTVAEVEANPGSPHVRAPTRESDGRIGHRLRNGRIGRNKPSRVAQIQQGVNGMQRTHYAEYCAAEDEQDGDR